MVEKMIENYVYNMSKQDIIIFANKHDITLSSNEVNIIYDTIKKFWKDIVFNDHNLILNSIVDKINTTTYKKLEKLVIFYKEKYKNYL